MLDPSTRGIVRPLNVAGPHWWMEIWREIGFVLAVLQEVVGVEDGLKQAFPIEAYEVLLQFFHSRHVLAIEISIRSSRVSEIAKPSGRVQSIVGITKQVGFARRCTPSCLNGHVLPEF